jgi:uncharacterized zinc-type alcohol dehydrogenase-like protein
MKVSGYAAKAAGRPLEPFEYVSPELGPSDVRVAISHCGVCHTDIHAIDDYYGITGYPFVPGHEIVGRVIEVGRAVAGLERGDRVGIGWQGRSCMKCEWCLRGEEQLCVDIVPCATWEPYGGFSSSVVVNDRHAYPLPPAMPSHIGAVLMCAGITVYSPLRRFAGDRDQKVAIVGVGGLGHLAIQFAKALGYEVTAISSSPEKMGQALAFGADHFIDAQNTSRLRQVDFTFDLLLLTTSGGVAWEALLMTLKKRGKLLLLGFPDIAFNSTDLVAHELSITGSFLGNRETMRQMLTFAQDHRITPEIELLPMSQVNEGLRRVRENRARYRVVLVNEEPISGPRQAR